ncbi:MAG TPA: helix-turn-helix domain-containing protein [Solirubrobacteraceae bacterium]|nr:helix-turn-helix domain-containing protein [Solirubrobacteraceae bacterium]
MPRRRRERPIETVPRRLLTGAEAAASLGVSVAHFERYVQPFVKVVPCGQLLLIEPASLDRWVQERARFASAVA